MALTVAGVAAIVGLIGGAASGLNSFFGNLHENEQSLQRQYRNLRAKRDENLAYLQKQFDVAKDEANKNADESDRQQTLKEDFLARDINNEFEGLIAREEAEGLAFNQQMAANDAAEGDSLSQMAASGTRGSSMQQAVDLQSASNALQLQTAENQARAGDDYALTNILAAVANGTEEIQQARTKASDLRLSYDDGSVYGNGEGNQYGLFKLNYQNTKNDYDRTIDELETQRNHMLWKSNIALGALSSMFGGAANGLQTGYNIGNTLYNSGLTFDTGKGLTTKAGGN